MSDVKNINIAWRAMVNRADPDHEREKRREIEYEFSGRTFRADPKKRGAYTPDEE